MPLINVVIPTRERADTLFWTLKTCVEQDYDNYNIWVSDNCSTDNTEEVVRSFRDSRIRYIKTPRRISMSHNWEFALGHLDEGYAIIIGDDDGLVVNSLGYLGNLIDQTGALAVRPPNIVYCWPEHPEDYAKGMLNQVSLKDGYELTDSTAMLREISVNLEYYHPYFLDLPTIYHGCISVELIGKIRERDGAFLRTCCPDMYSAVITSAETDTYIKLYRPVCINGMSKKSTGISAALPNFHNSEAERFFSEDPIPFHQNLLPSERKVLSVLSRPVLIADQFLYAREKNPAVPPVDMENVIRKSLESLNGWRWKSIEQYNFVIENTRDVARLNGLESMTEELIEQYPFRGKSSFIRGNTNYDLKSRTATIDTISYGAKNVYDASRIITNLVQSMPEISDNNSFKRILKRATTLPCFSYEKSSSNHTFINPELSIESMDNYLVRTTILMSLKEFISSTSGVLLDIGCGEMPYKELIACKYPQITRYIGLDIENPKYQHKCRPDMYWDGKTIPLDNDFVDCAVATELFEHLSDVETVLKEIRRVLKPGGKLFFTMPFLWPLHDMPQDEYRYTPFSLHRHLENAGFGNIQIFSMGGWDASLAQMIGLWVKRRPMNDERRKELIELLYPFYKQLIETEMKSDPLDYEDMLKQSTMITGLKGTAEKSLVRNVEQTESETEAECPICGSISQSFLPYGIIKRPNAMCPTCNSLERHRLLWLYLKSKTGLFSGNKKVLDIAPTKIISEKMKRMPNIDYLSIDKFSSLAMKKMDITSLDLQDNTFDCILCYHVLEHVPDDRRAIREILRVLKPGGWAIIQVPLKPGLVKTVEGAHISDPAERKRLFGQEDHVRYYGLDYKDRLEEEGFVVKCDPFAKTLSHGDIKRFAVFSDEDIYFCSKPEAKRKSNLLLSENIRDIDTKCRNDICEKNEPVRIKEANKIPGSSLAVVCPQVGAASETFIRKHIELLLPEHTVVITGGVVDGSWLKAPLIRVPHTRGWARYSSDIEAKIVRFVGEHRVTHILCEFGSAGTGMVELNERILHLPLYVHFHGQDASEELRNPEMVDYFRWMGKNVSGVIAVSKPMAERLKQIGIPEKKINIIHSGVYVPESIFASPANLPCRFITVSRLVPKKGIHYLLQAFSEARKEVPGITLDIIGEGPLRKEIEEFIRNNGLEDFVSLQGQREHDYVLDMLCRSSVYAQHSITDPATGNSEGLPVGILEASAYGLPVISTFHEGIPEAVDHNVTGLLVNEGDAGKMAEYMVRLANDGNLRKEMGLAGRRKISEGFTVDISIGKLRNFMGISTKDSECEKLANKETTVIAECQGAGKSENKPESTPRVQKILFINHNLAPYEHSGTPITTLNHALGMKERGLDVAVLIPSPEVKTHFKVDKISDIAVYKVARFDKYKAFLSLIEQSELDDYLQSIEQIIKEFLPDVVHINDYVYMPSQIIESFHKAGCLVVRSVCNDEEICHQDYPVVASGVEGKLCIGPETVEKCAECFLKCRIKKYKEGMKQKIEDSIGKRISHIRRIYASNIDGVVFTEARFKEHFMSFVPVQEEKIRIIPRGFNFSFKRNCTVKAENTNTVRFAFVGSIIFSKGIDVVLKAFELLSDLERFTLHIYGYVVEKSYLPWIDRLQERYPDKIIFHGPFIEDDLPGIAEQVDICIIPSYFDTYNRVVREMLYCGVPVITTDFFGASIIKNGFNGLKVPVGDYEALAQAMKNIIDNPFMIQKLSDGVLKTGIPALSSEINAMLDFYEYLYKKKESKADCKESPIKLHYNNHDDKQEPSQGVRAIAFYLPQFHPIPENDAWWGKGFTEWTNVSKSKPLFEGHYQPHIPSELGLYDLRIHETRMAQAALAREHGIHGFCYYHYWFSGKRLLNRPLDDIIASGTPDFPFCLCWANENWTRVWDGQEKEILLKQEYSEKDDIEHISFLCNVFRDKRYIKVTGKPLFLVYRANKLPNPLKTAGIWREEARKLGIGEIYLCRVESFPDEHTDPASIGFDASIEFQPDWSRLPGKLKSPEYVDHAVFSYKELMQRMLTKPVPKYKRYPCVSPGFDNSPRRKSNAYIFTGSSPELYELWLKESVRKLNNEAGDKLVFINAWNEWGEGNHLEPDERFGRAYLEATKCALTDGNKEEDFAVLNDLYKEIQSMITGGRHDEAIESLEQALNLKIGEALIHNDLGVLYYRAGNKEKSLKHYEQAVAIDPENTVFQKNLADFYCIELKRFDDAMKIYANLLNKNPGDIEVLLSIGYVCMILKDYRLALSFYKKVSEADPENPIAGEKIDHIMDLLEENHGEGFQYSRNTPIKEETADNLHDNSFEGDFTDKRRFVEGLTSIIIPVFNKIEYTRRCLEAVKNNAPDTRHEIIIVDNASTDGTGEFLKSLSGHVRVITNTVNLGFTLACNQGARAAAGEYVLFLNNDTEPQTGWLESMIDLMESDSKNGIVGSKLIYPDGRLQEAGGIIFSDGSGWNYGRFDDPKKPVYNYVREVDYVSGASLMIRHSLLRQLNYFDEQYSPGYYEDTDLCFGARALEYKVMYCPSSVVIHHEGISSGTDLKNGMKKHQVINKDKFASKWRNYLKVQFMPGGMNVIPASERSVKGNILIIDPFFPKFDRASGSLRLFTIIKILKELNYHITYIARNGKGQQRYEKILNRLGVETYSADSKKLEEPCRNSASPEQDFTEILRLRYYDVALLSFYETAVLYLDIIRRTSPGTKIVIDTVDIHFIREMRMAELSGDKKLMKKAYKTKKDELSIYHKADALATVTEKDWEHIGKYLTDMKHFVVPNIHEVPDNVADPKDRNGLVFIGNFNHPPNTDAVRYFIDNILTLIKKEIPDISFAIVGNNPPEEILNLKNEFIQVTGYVPLTEPYLESARVSVAPLRYGAGMKGKIGEAMAHGLPVVTTSIGAEGMGLTDGRTVSIADTPEAFAEKVIQLCKNDSVWHEISEAGREFIKKNYSKETVGEKISEIVESLIDNKTDHKNLSNDREIKKGLTSIIVLTFNGLRNTKECVESIRNHTPNPYEIIFVDNGSTDGTVKWLRQLAGNNQNYKIIENKSNLGFAKGCNQGIKMASGEYILLLNNDVVVTESWLSGMLECLNSSESAGIVGPMTNNISGIQKVAGTEDMAVDALSGYAKTFRETNRHRRIPARRIAGFCMMFRHELVREIGVLDEAFGSGNFEDDDICLRAALAGYKNIIAGDVFIHHYGSRSFINNRIDYKAAMADNRKIFTEKWSGFDRDSETGIKLSLLKALERADNLRQLGRAENSFREYLGAIRLNPDDVRVYNSFAEMLIEEQRFQDALEVLNQSPARDSDKDPMLLKAQCLEGLEKIHEAEKIIDKILSHDSTNATALNLKGQIAYKKGAAIEAERLFLMSAEADPSYGEPFTNLGVLKWSAGKAEEALDLTEKGFILLPYKNDIAAIYHSVAAASGKYERCEKTLSDSRGLYPNNRRTAFLLIDVLIKQGKNLKALENIQEAMLTFGKDDGMIDAALEIRNRMEETNGKQTAGNGKKAGVSAKTLSLCMIVKNEEETLPACLMSMRAIADEIIIVDTGSTDRTKDIAKIFGAKVFEFQWTGDFSEARNYSLSKATGDWIFVLDADEVISAQDHTELRELIDNGKLNTAYSVTTRNYVNTHNVAGWINNGSIYSKEEKGKGWFPGEKVRLFPNRKGIEFRNRVHELVEASLEDLNIRVKKCNIPVHHYGKLEENHTKAKGENYYMLGIQKVGDSVSDPKAIYELAVQAGELDRHQEALELWHKLLEITKPPVSDEVSLKAYINMGHAYLHLGRYQEAFEVSKKAFRLSPDSVDAIMNYSLAEIWTGEPARAIPEIKRLLEKSPDMPQAIGLLGIAYIITGENEQGWLYLERITKKGYNCANFIYEHSQKLIAAGRTEYANKLINMAVEKGATNEKILKFQEENTVLRS